MIPALLALLLASPAWGHDWYTGLRSDYGLGLCCSGSDCVPLPAEQMSCDADGCDITVAPGQHPLYAAGGVFRFDGIPRSSPDGNAHVCIYPPGREQATRGQYDGVARCAWWGGGS